LADGYAGVEELSILKVRLVEDKMSDDEKFTTRTGVEYKEWICPKCGILRDNMHTHKHGVPLEVKGYG